MDLIETCHYDEIPYDKLTILIGFVFAKNVRLDGVARCVVGYSGGVEPNPNYGQMMDYTESLLVEFDPNVVTYERILKEVRQNELLMW